MSTIEIIIGSGPHQRIFRFEEDALAYRSLTLIIEQLNPFLPARLAAEGYDIRILSTEAPSGEVIGGIRISKLVDEGQVNIRLLDQDGRQIEIDRELLERIVLIPSGDRPTHMNIARNRENASPLPVESAMTGQSMDVNLDSDSRSESGPGQSPTEPGLDPSASLRTGLKSSSSDRLGKSEAHIGSTQPNAHQRTPGVGIRIWEKALRKAREHARKYPSHEVGGICMGILRKDRRSGQLIVEITDTFIAEHTINRGSSVTFTPDTWSAANRIIDRDYAKTGECMVGWYHTHPGFGVFLSSYDLFVHEHFFTQPWHIALVIDPLRQEEGVFVWTQGGGRRRIRRCRDVEVLEGSYPRPVAVPEKLTSEKPEAQPVECAQVQEAQVALQEQSAIEGMDEGLIGSTEASDRGSQ